MGKGNQATVNQLYAFLKEAFSDATFSLRSARLKADWEDFRREYRIDPSEFATRYEQSVRTADVAPVEHVTAYTTAKELVYRATKLGEESNRREERAKAKNSY